jgi:hypothetical protein
MSKFTGVGGFMTVGEMGDAPAPSLSMAQLLRQSLCHQPPTKDTIKYTLFYYQWRWTFMVGIIALQIRIRSGDLHP